MYICIHTLYIIIYYNTYMCIYIYIYTYIYIYISFIYYGMERSCVTGQARPWCACKPALAQNDVCCQTFPRPFHSMITPQHTTFVYITNVSYDTIVLPLRAVKFWTLMYHAYTYVHIHTQTSGAYVTWHVTSSIINVPYRCLFFPLSCMFQYSM